MKIVRTSATTICPSVREELLKRKGDTFYNLQRGLRHPLGIYNLSLINIWETFKEVLDELDIVLDQQIFRLDSRNGNWGHTLLRRQEDLISRIMRHFDDCESLISCFYPVSRTITSHKDTDADLATIRGKSEVKAVASDFLAYRKHIAATMNHIKHRQGMLRGMAVFNDDIAIIGYFVENVNQQGELESHPDVHPLFKGMHTAFSFYRDLRFKFWLVYAVSELVSTVIQNVHSSTANVQEFENLEEQSLMIARRLENLPKYLFNDEIYMDFPAISVKENSNGKELILEYPSTMTILPTLTGKQKVVSVQMSDGITQSYQLPYYNVSTIPKVYLQARDSK